MSRVAGRGSIMTNPQRRIGVHMRPDEPIALTSYADEIAFRLEA